MNTDRMAQIGIIVALIGGVTTFVGFFPGAMGLDNAAGVGFFQIMVVLFGFALIILGAYVFVQATYYPDANHNFPQQIATRLSLTGLILSLASGLADVLGIGSNPFIGDQRGYFGTIQFAGMFGGFVIASLGVLIFALLGDPNFRREE